MFDINRDNYLNHLRVMGGKKCATSTLRFEIKFQPCYEVHTPITFH